MSLFKELSQPLLIGRNIYVTSHHAHLHRRVAIQKKKKDKKAKKGKKKKNFSGKKNGLITWERIWKAEKTEQKSLILSSSSWLASEFFSELCNESFAGSQSSGFLLFKTLFS